MTESWWQAGNRWLCTQAEHHFALWSASPAGKRWRANRRKRDAAPYYYGYRQPDWMADARESLGRGEEERFKAIKLANL